MNKEKSNLFNTLHRLMESHKNKKFDQLTDKRVFYVLHFCCTFAINWPNKIK